MEYPKFINGEEGQQVFAGFSKVDMSGYPVKTLLKSWTGAYYGVYQYEDNKLNPVLLDKLKLVHVEVRRQGPSGLLVSMINGSVTEVTCVPCLLKNGQEVAMSFPQRTYFEKTLQDFGGSDLVSGLSCCLQAFHQQRPDWNSDRVPFIALWGDVRNRFTDFDSFTREVSVLKGRVKLV